MKSSHKISIVSGIVIGLTAAFSFAQYDQLLPKQGDAFTITTVPTKIEQSSTTFKWFNSYVIYSGRNISFKAKTPLTEKPQILTKTSRVIMFNSGTFPGAHFPFVSNIIPKVGALGVVSEVYVIDNDAGTYIGNPNVARGQLSSQLCIEAIYRTIDTTNSPSKTSNAYFIAKAADKASETYTLPENDSKLFTTDKYLTGCDNYYIAYCGDGKIDKKTGDGATDGQGGMTVDGTFLTWNLGPTTDEVCDDGLLNGTSGKCKKDCSGIGTGEQPSGDFTITKSVVDNKTYSIGENVQFKITFTNNTNQTLNNVKIEDYLPAGYTYVSSEISGAPAPYYFSTGTEGGTTKISYTGFSLSAGAGGYILLTTKLNVCGNETLNIALGYAGAYSGRASAQAICSTNPLTLTKSVAKSVLVPGETTEFIISATNNLSTALTNLSLQDIWPSNGCVYLTGSYSANTTVQGTQNSNVSTWTFGSLAAGQTFTIRFNGYVKPDASCAGAYTNTAKLSYNDGSGPKENTAIANFSVAQISQSMSITKKVTQQGSGPGDIVVFKITYKNNGISPINGFKITDIWPAALDFVSANPLPRNASERPLTWDYSNITLQPNQEGTITVTGKIKTTIR